VPALVRLAEKLEEKKSQAVKLKRKTERELKKSKLLQKVSVSGLASIERKIDWGRENLSDVTGILTQKLAQQESIQRLLSTAEERLNREKEAKQQTEEEIEFSDSIGEKESAQARLHSILDRINEATFEIKQRKKMTKKVVDTIEEFKKSKSKISNKIHKEIQEKPELQKLIKKSKKSSVRLAKQFVSKTTQEENTKKYLKKVKLKLEEFKAKKRKFAAKRAALKRKLAAQRKKRKTSKKPKRKTSRVKRKTSKKPKRKSSRVKRKTSKKPKRKSSRVKRKTSKKPKRR